MKHSRIVWALMLAGSLVSSVASCLAQDQAMAGIWLPDNNRSQRVPSTLPYTARGQALVNAWQAGRDPLLDDPGLYCQSPGMPSIALSGAGYPLEIVLDEDKVLVLYEAHQLVRRVFLDQAHPEKPFPQRNGYSVGVWQGDSLLVDTIGIRPILFGAVPHSEQVQVSERFQVADDGDTLLSRITISDPVMYTEAMAIERAFTRAPEGSQMLEYECSEAMWVEHQESRGLQPFTSD